MLFTNTSMPVHVLVTGPIRPSLNSVLNLHSQAKRYFPGCTTHLVYWTSTPGDHDILINTFDHVYDFKEPSDSYIDSVADCNTIQTRQQPERLGRTKYNIFKALFASRLMIGAVDISDSDIVVKLRTDCYLFDVDKTALSSLVESVEPEVYYTIPRPFSAANGVCDIFGIALFGTFKKVWNIRNDMCHIVYGNSFNPENAIKLFMLRKGVKLGTIPRNMINLAICRLFEWTIKLEILL